VFVRVGDVTTGCQFLDSIAALVEVFLVTVFGMNDPIPDRMGSYAEIEEVVAHRLLARPGGCLKQPICLSL
jgi:hypothetical protein